MHGCYDLQDFLNDGIENCRALAGGVVETPTDNGQSCSSRN